MKGKVENQYGVYLGVPGEVVESLGATILALIESDNSDQVKLMALEALKEATTLQGNSFNNVHVNFKGDE